MYRYEDIQTVHLEVTQNCQAACPMCDRNMNGEGINPHINLDELSPSTPENWDYLSDFIIGSHSLVGFNESFISGPAVVALHSSSTFVSYKLTRASEVEYKQANIVSLPAETVGQGTHEIVVEASHDLQTWTPVHSSSIGGNKTFFRID